jgi:hypothetical protein
VRSKDYMLEGWQARRLESQEGSKAGKARKAGKERKGRQRREDSFSTLLTNGLVLGTCCSGYVTIVEP